MKARHNVKSKSILNQSNVTFLIALGLIILLGLAVIVSFIKFSERNTELSAQRLVDSVGLAIEERLHFYQTLVDNIAARKDTQIILELGAVSEAEAWSSKQRQLIPNAISLALVDKDTQVMGDAGELRVGPQCRTDLRNYIDRDQSYRMSLHDEIPEFAHFDVVSPVTDDSGMRIGLVFASFSIDVLNMTLKKLAGDQSNMVLRGENGRVITEYQQVDAGNFYRAESTLNKGDWHLQLEIIPHRDHITILGLIAFMFAVALLFMTLMIILSRRQVTGLLSEFENIRQHLDAVLNYDSDKEPLPARYRETEAILPTIHSLSHAMGSRARYLSRLSETDSLTGLGNRRSYDEKIRHAWESVLAGNRLHLIYLDLDYFKQCNDHYGHATGDSVLKMFAECLTQHTRPNDVLIRMGGDEFVVMLEGMQEDAIDEWYQRIADCFQQRQVEAGINEPRCTVSAGATHMRAETDTVEAVAKQADSALYEAKGQGRGRLVIHENVKSAT
ncbi:MAG: GGDEF domain-containing protein [Gammaproteobacteria bacterium]|nr:GGDEF domain-containing protein [Gammaproteobacteria bacterium]